MTRWEQLCHKLWRTLIPPKPITLSHRASLGVPMTVAVYDCLMSGGLEPAVEGPDMGRLAFIPPLNTDTHTEVQI